jgi:Carboxypeptidase regulatory-like domain/TonB-dependent Receptor Plug Domain
MLLQFHSSAVAQFDTAVVLGTVTDPSGAAIAGGEVTLRNTALGTMQTKKTSASGDYEFPGVQIDSYTVSATAPGFTSVTTNAFDVTISARQRANISLGIGNVSQGVTISAGATGLETDTSDQSQLIEQKQIVDLPLNGHEYTDLALLTTGVQVGVLQNGTVNQRRGSFVVNGMRSSANNFLLDGLDNNDYQIANQGFNNEAVDESVDAVQEFRVDTSNFAVEYGRAGGAIIDVSTRSGIKDFHGSAWESTSRHLDAFPNNRSISSLALISRASQEEVAADTCAS